MYYLKYYGFCNSNYLMHHGVKGQQWGVRNGPPYPIETGYKKGSKVHSVSYSRYFDKKRNNPLYVYNPNNKHDSAVYKGPFAKYQLSRRSNYYKNVYDKTYKIKKDLNMPTSKERKDEFVKMINENPEYLKDLKYIQDMWKDLKNDGFSLTPRKERIVTHEVNWNKIKKEDHDVLYDMFNSCMEAWNNFASTRKYVEIMSTKYDAMVDDNNAGVYNDALDPVIIFNSGDNLKLLNVRSIPMREVNKNYNQIRDYMEAKGQRVAL